MTTPNGLYRMPQTAIPTAAGETAGSGRAPHYLLAYLEEGRVRVYAPDKSDIWIGVQLPEAEETRVEAELQRIHRTGQRTGIVEICLSAAGVQRGMRVLCVRA
ncbi:hypothetical protein [Alistipes sp.]|uniref:hypothetical protein n=1 Tax=Alistipes sp. TaxID=1872444 RepID=UPI0023F23E7C|nr:hypothetical protein [Alistipes sp.]